MSDEPKDGDELDPDEQAGADLDNDDGGDGDEPVETPEEIKAQRDEYKRRLDKQRTAKAREARAAKRAGGSPAPKPEDDAAAKAAAEELAAKDAKIAELEARANRATALSVAAELGFKKPATAVKLVEWDDLDDPSDEDEVRAALRQVAKDNPELKKPAPKADGGEGTGSGSSTRSSFNDIIRKAAGRG